MSFMLRTLSALALALAAPLASAGHVQWEMVELPPESDAACRDQKACFGEGKLVAARPASAPRRSGCAPTWASRRS